jgi:hypothetical protein
MIPAAVASDNASARRNGCPTGRTVSGAPAPQASATTAPSVAPMLRMPITRVPRTRARAGAR